MNKEIVLKNLRAFKHWLKEGKLLVKCIDSSGNIAWKNEKKVKWDNVFHLGLKETHYLIDDKYIDFRKAMTEGKIVQFKPSLRADDLGYGFTDIYYPIEEYDIELLRIKPEEK